MAEPVTAIRVARPDEIEAVARLNWSVWHETQAPLQPPAVAAHRELSYFLRRTLALPQPPVVAITDVSLRGFGAWTGSLLGQLFVAADARGSGVGAELLAACERAIAGSGHRRATLLVIKGNERAQAFYERHGWIVLAASVIDAATSDGSVPVEVIEMSKVLSTLG